MASELPTSPIAGDIASFNKDDLKHTQTMVRDGMCACAIYSFVCGPIVDFPMYSFIMWQWSLF